MKKKFKERNMKAIIINEELIKKCQTEGKKIFNRINKITPEDIIYQTINNLGLSTELNIRKYELNIKGSEKVEYTKEAYLKKRRNLNPEAFKYLNDKYMHSFYKEGLEEEIEKYAGYIILACDGSKIEVPNTEENRKHFGYQKNQGDVVKARGLISGLYDVINKFYVDIQLGNYNTKESELFKENLKRMVKSIDPSKAIIVFDRNYPSIEFINYLEENNIKYLMRMQSNIYLKEKRLMEREDEWVEIKHTENRLSKLKGQEIYEQLKEKGKSKVRFTKVTLEDKVEWLVSNIQQEITREQLKYIYGLRWQIERGYNSLKNKLQIENYSGKKPIIIYQDIYASMFMYNIISDVVTGPIEKEKSKKYEYQINENKAIGIFKEEFIKILLLDDIEKQNEAYQKMIKDISNFKCPIRKGRKNNPRTFNRTNKYSPNMKRSY